MTTRTHTIEVDEATATALEERAAARGLSVAQLLAQILRDESAGGEADPDQVAELDRRWAAHRAGQPTVPHAEVVRWLESWGTPAYKPWRDR